MDWILKLIKLCIDLKVSLKLDISISLTLNVQEELNYQNAHSEEKKKSTQSGIASAIFLGAVNP